MSDRASLTQTKHWLRKTAFSIKSDCLVS